MASRRSPRTADDGATSRRPTDGTASRRAADDATSRRTADGATSRRKASTAATLGDVATHAGVSPATVSRVLAGNYPVSRSARQRVLRSIRELNYVANTHARALAGVQTKTIAFVLADVRGPSFAEAAHGVEQEAARLGWLCLIGTTQGDPERELAIVRLMREQRAGAVVLIGGVADADDYEEQMTELAHSLRSAGSLLVLCGRPPLAKGVPAAVIGYDNEEGAYAITSHVLSQGHRRILYLGGEERHTTSLGRLNGYRRALATFGAEFDPSLVEYGVFTRTSGYQLTKKRLAGKRDFTAVFAATDVMAAGVYAAVNEAGLNVPNDISIVGYDDIELAQDLRPRMTSVHVPYEELGRTAAKVAADEDHQREDWPGLQVTLKTHVVVRDSVARLD